MDEKLNPLTATMGSGPYERQPERGAPARSAYAYIDYLEGCLTELRLRLESLENAQGALAMAFYRRSQELETRLKELEKRDSKL
jgi:hypothetical protein